MTYFCPTIDELPEMAEPDPRGFSAAAISVARELRAALAHYRSPRLAQIQLEIMDLSEREEAIDNYAPLVDRDTAEMALSFAQLLPRSLPAPEISADPDGEVSFDWLGSAGKMFSVSVNKDGRISYAGRFGDKSKVHGIEQLSEVHPQEIVRGIQKAVR